MTTTPSSACSRCGSDELERIHRSQFIKLFFYWLPLRHYQCMKCCKKTYRIVRKGKTSKAVMI